MPQPEVLIKAIRQSFVGAEQVYTQGSCVMFYLILKSVYPNITGKVKCSKDYVIDDKETYTCLPIASAFPGRQMRHRFTTATKL
jgi:hypothetical protein